MNLPGISQTAQNLFESALTLTYYDIYLRLLLAATGKERLRIAVAGGNGYVMPNLEALADCGIDPYNVGFYLGDASDPFHSRAPLDNLDPANYELLIVAANDAQGEHALVAELVAHLRKGPAYRVPIFLDHRFRNALYAAAFEIDDIRSVLNPRKLAVVALAAFLSRSGCILECGSFRGGTSLFMALMLRTWADDRRIHAFDTYEGMPAATPKDGETIYNPGLFTEVDYQDTCAYFARHGCGETITAHKGLVQDTLPPVLEQERDVSLALIDTDQYSSTLKSLQCVVPKLSTNGLILVDDYGIEGVRHAVDEIQAAYPSLRGTHITMNFYVMWQSIDQNFISSIRTH